MSSLALVVLASFILGYCFYLAKLKKIFPFDPSATTPAHAKYDGIDYVPARSWLVLFGHHFASIAGAAPIIGPIIAVAVWGWLPSIFWIVLGAIFLGGVHDFGSLMTSLKNEGNSIAEISQATISSRAKYLFAGFVLLTLILIIAVFVFFCAKTLMEKPEVVIPSLGLIPLAILIGILMYRFNVNFPLLTFFGILGLVILILLGERFPISLNGNPIRSWSILLLIYCFFASIMPVNILLQPRDYLSSFLLFAGLGIGFLGIFISNPAIQAPTFIKWQGNLGPLWPMLFVTIACGAISGFHSLIASGTTSKQLSEEKYAPRIGYGAMLLEGALASLALFAVVTLSFKDLQMLIKDGGPVAAFGKGFGKISFSLLGSYGEVFAMMLLNGFILTTLDTATRIARYIFQELFQIRSKMLTTLIIVLLSGWLAISGGWSSIWPIFGAGNQLIAALSLLVISTWLLSLKRNCLITLLPALFMLATTMGALIYKLPGFIKRHDYLLIVISSVLLFLSLFLLLETIQAFRKKLCLKK